MNVTVDRIMQNKHARQHVRRALLAVCAVGALVIATPLQAFAATSSLQPTAKVSFTFDDGLQSALNKAAPALAAYGYTGTNYVITNCVATTGTCPADPDAAYMNWTQVLKLRDTYKWEIGSHGVTHPLLTQVSAAQLQNEVATSKQVFANHGINTTSFATPYGDYNDNVKAAIAKYYTNHRPFADQEWGNDWPYDDYLLYVKQVQAGVSVAQVKQYIDQAKQNKQWLVLVFHGIADNPSTNPEDYQYSTANLKQIAAYVQQQGLPVVNASEGMAQSGTNMLANSSFDNGVADGWTTDAPANVIKDTAMHGNFPSPQNSIAFKNSTTQATHLFSPQVTVDSAKSYLVKSYLNVQKLTSGEVTYYVDEYDANGNWISGQYKRGVRTPAVAEINIPYTPSSANVKKAAFQIAVGANSGIVGYVDNVQWFPTN